MYIYIHIYIYIYIYIYAFIGWAVKLGNIQVLEKILQRGFNLNVPCDVLGNNLIHLIAKYGDKDMIDLVCNMHTKIDYEILNYYGYTAIMEGVRNGNYIGIRNLLLHGGNSSRGLEAKYSAWLLVLIRKEEKTEFKTEKNGNQKVEIFFSNTILKHGFKSGCNESSDKYKRKNHLKLSKHDIQLLRKKFLNMIMNHAISI
jgi:hypothetical protein